MNTQEQFKKCLVELEDKCGVTEFIRDDPDCYNTSAWELGEYEWKRMFIGHWDGDDFHDEVQSKEAYEHNTKMILKQDLNIDDKQFEKMKARCILANKEMKKTMDIYDGIGIMYEAQLEREKRGMVNLNDDVMSVVRQFV